MLWSLNYGILMMRQLNNDYWIVILLYDLDLCWKFWYLSLLGCLMITKQSECNSVGPWMAFMMVFVTKPLETGLTGWFGNGIKKWWLGPAELMLWVSCFLALILSLSLSLSRSLCLFFHFFPWTIPARHDSFVKMIQPTFIQVNLKANKMIYLSTIPTKQ